MGSLDKEVRVSKIHILRAGVAQLVERNLAKVEVASSRLVSRSKFQWRDSKVVMQRIANPSTPVRFRLSPPIYTAGWQSVYAAGGATLVQAG